MHDSKSRDKPLVRRSPLFPLLLVMVIAAIVQPFAVHAADNEYEEISEDVSDLCESVELGDGTYYLVAAYKGNAVALASTRSGSKQPYVGCEAVQRPIYRSFEGRFVVESTCGRSTVRFYFKDHHGASDFAVQWGGVTTVEIVEEYISKSPVFDSPALGDGLKLVKAAVDYSPEHFFATGRRLEFTVGGKPERLALRCDRVREQGSSKRGYSVDEVSSLFTVKVACMDENKAKMTLNIPFEKNYVASDFAANWGYFTHAIRVNSSAANPEIEGMRVELNLDSKRPRERLITYNSVRYTCGAVYVADGSDGGGGGFSMKADCAQIGVWERGEVEFKLRNVREGRRIAYELGGYRGVRDELLTKIKDGRVFGEKSGIAKVTRASGEVSLADTENTIKQRLEIRFGDGGTKSMRCLPIEGTNGLRASYGNFLLQAKCSGLFTELLFEDEISMMAFAVEWAGYRPMEEELQIGFRDSATEVQIQPRGVNVATAFPLGMAYAERWASYLDRTDRRLKSRRISIHIPSAYIRFTESFYCHRVKEPVHAVEASNNGGTQFGVTAYCGLIGYDLREPDLEKWDLKLTVVFKDENKAVTMAKWWGGYWGIPGRDCKHLEIGGKGVAGDNIIASLEIDPFFKPAKIVGSTITTPDGKDYLCDGVQDIISYIRKDYAISLSCGGKPSTLHCESRSGSSQFAMQFGMLREVKIAMHEELLGKCPDVWGDGVTGGSYGAAEAMLLIKDGIKGVADRWVQTSTGKSTSCEAVEPHMMWVNGRYVFSSQCGGKSTKIGCSAKKTAEDFALGWGDTEISDISISADIIKKCSVVSVGESTSKLLGAAYDPATRQRTIMISSSKTPIVCSEVAEAPIDMDLLGEYHIITKCGERDAVVKCTEPGAAVKLARLWGSYSNSEIQIDKSLLVKCTVPSGTKALVYEVAEDGQWKGTTRAWVTEQKGLTCATPVPDLKFIGDEILVRTTCGAEVLEMSCGGLEGIKETMRIVTRWGENPNPKIIISKKVMEQCKGLLTNAGDEDIVESAWLRVNSDGSQIERYLWTAEAIQCDYGVKSAMTLSGDSVKVTTQCAGKEGAVVVSCDGGDFGAAREFAKNWGGWDNPVVVLDPALYSSCAVEVEDDSARKPIGSITYNIDTHDRNVVFPDRSHETCGSPSGPPVLVVDDDDDVGLYLLHVPCDNRVGITCSLPGNAVDISTFFGYQTREITVREVKKCKAKSSGMSPLGASVDIDADGKVGARMMTWPSSWEPMIASGEDSDGEPIPLNSTRRRPSGSPERVLKREVVDSDEDPVYREWHFWIELEFKPTRTECQDTECIVYDHLDCGDVATTLFLSKWWLGNTDARVRIDDPIMEHCGGPVGASRLVDQRELPYDAKDPLECNAVTLPIMMDASNGYVVTADCGPRRDSVTMVTCDGLEWAQLFAHGWGDMEKAGVALPTEVIESCKQGLIGDREVELTGAYYDDETRYLIFASMESPIECGAVVDAPEDMDLVDEYHVKVDCGGKDGVILRCDDAGSAVTMAFQWGKYPKQEVRVSSELLLQCDDLPNGQVLDDLTYDVGMDGKWQGTPRRWGDAVCSTPVPDLVFRGDRIYIITACGHSKEEISCGGLDSVGTMLRIAARWGEHPDPRIMIDGSVVEHCKDVENLNGGTLTEAWITAAIDGKVSGRFLKTTTAYDCYYGVREPLVVDGDSINMMTKCSGVQSEVLVQCDDSSAVEFAENWGGFDGSAAIGLDGSKYDSCKVKPVGREEYESISVVLMDLATKAKMMQFGSDDTPVVCKSTSTTPPVVIVKKGTTTAIYRFSLECAAGEVTVSCTEAGDAVDLNTFMGFPTREVAVPETTQCKSKHGVNPLSATIEIAADGSEGLRYLTWPKEYIVEHEPKPEVPSLPVTPASSPSRGPSFESSARANYGGFRNSEGADNVLSTRAVPTSAAIPTTTTQTPSGHQQGGGGDSRPRHRATLEISDKHHRRGRGYHVKPTRVGKQHPHANTQRRGGHHGKPSNNRVFPRRAENHGRGTIPRLPHFGQLPSFIEIGPGSNSESRKAVRPMTGDPIYRDWYFGIDIDYVVSGCSSGENCAVVEHLDCGSVENTLYVATWWGGRKNSRIRIDDSIMEHCGGPLGASRVVGQRELPLDPARPLSCAPVTTPIINRGAKGHVVVAYCGPQFKERHEVRCDASIWAQHFAYGWGDSDNSGLDISPDLVKACRKVTVEHIDNLHTLLSASLKGATIRPGSSNDGNNFRTKRELKLTFHVSPYRYEPSIFHYHCERVTTAVEIPEQPGAPRVASVRALCDFDDSHKAFVKLECPESAAITFAIKWGGFSQRAVGLGPEIMSHSTKVVRGSEDLGPAIAATMGEDRGKYYLQTKNAPGVFVCDKAEAKIVQTEDLQFTITVSCPSHIVDSRAQANAEARLTVYFDDPYAAIGFLVRWGRVTDAKVESYYATKFTSPAPQVTVKNSLPEIHVDNHICSCPAKAPIVYSPRGEARVTFSSKPLITVTYKDRMVAMAAAMMAGHRLSEIVLDTNITHHVTHISVDDNVYMGKEEEHPLKRVALLISGENNKVDDHIIEMLRPDLVSGPLEDFGLRRYHSVAYNCGRQSGVAVDGLTYTVKCEEGELPQGSRHHYSAHLTNTSRKAVDITLKFDDAQAVTAFVSFWTDDQRDAGPNGEVDAGVVAAPPINGRRDTAIINAVERPDESRLSTGLREVGSPESTPVKMNTTHPAIVADESETESPTLVEDKKVRRHVVRHNINNANKYRMRASVSE